MQYLSTTKKDLKKNNNNFEQLWKEKPEKPHRVLAKSERKSSVCACTTHCGRTDFFVLFVHI